MERAETTKRSTVGETALAMPGRLEQNAVPHVHPQTQIQEKAATRMIDHAGVSEQGPVRSNNEDYIAHCYPEDEEVRRQKGSLFVIADGVGGSRAGEVASKEAATTLVKRYYDSTRPAGRALQEAFQQANLHVYDLGHTNPEYRRMETTLSALALVGNQAFLGHVGDTRIYHVRGSDAQQLTRDHSEVGELLRMRILTPEEARHHPRRNIITRSVGSEPILQVEHRTVEVELGDAFVICSDGLWEPVEDAEIAEIIAKHTCEEACRKLIALAIERETGDNLSIQIVKVVKWEHAIAANDGQKPGLLDRALRFFRKDRQAQ